MPVTQNFLSPPTGSLSPTAAQVLNQNEVTVDLTTDGVFFTFVINHNMNIGAADLALGRPVVIITPMADPSTIGAFVSAATANTVTLNFNSIVTTLRVRIQRPHSIVR